MHFRNRFDSLTGSSCVGSLLQGMDRTSVLAHVRFLCGIVGAAGGASDEERDPLHAGESALDALVLLCKNGQLADRGLVTATVLGVLVRLACFSDGTNSGSIKSAKKIKKSKKIRAELVPEEAAAAVAECLQLLAVDLSCLAGAAANRLLSLLADVGHLLYSSAAEDSKLSFLDITVDLMRSISQSMRLLREEVEVSPAEVLQTALSAQLAMAASVAPSPVGLRLLDAIKNLLSTATVFILVSEDISLEVDDRTTLIVVYSTTLISPCATGATGCGGDTACAGNSCRARDEAGKQRDKSFAPRGNSRRGGSSRSSARHECRDGLRL
jgi:hypothetical protein